MKRNKMVFIYGLIMLVVVALIVILGYVTGPKHDESQEVSQTLIDEKQNSIRRLEEELEGVKKENSNLIVEKDELLLQQKNDAAKIQSLEAENKALKEQLDSAAALTEADAVTMAQALADLKDIYENHKSGNVQDAKAAFEKIDTNGYSDEVLAYYELLKDIMNADN